ncbi:MAG: hypothetical protein WBA07_12435 [Rivularia sp. (in: cyanobacteria)]
MPKASSSAYRLCFPYIYEAQTQEYTYGSAYFSKLAVNIHYSRQSNPCGTVITDFRLHPLISLLL